MPSILSTSTTLSIMDFSIDNMSVLDTKITFFKKRWLCRSKYRCM